ncbi:MAG: hypothetical protein QHH80_08125 [Anaerolineae bacterium]|nr:hypothetical protein [Anaerolineae bacterium]
MKRLRETSWLIVAVPSLAVVVWLFFLPFIRSAVTSFQTKDGAWTFQNYITAYRLYAGDVLYTIFVSAVSLTAVLIIGILVSGFAHLRWGRCRVPVQDSTVRALCRRGPRDASVPCAARLAELGACTN